MQIVISAWIGDDVRFMIATVVHFTHKFLNVIAKSCAFD